MDFPLSSEDIKKKLEGVDPDATDQDMDDISISQLSQSDLLSSSQFQEVITDL